MSLAAGTKLGPYQILAPIGAGGMGEVYRARDTKLGRDVAIKVLPHLLANDPERLARFEREAKVLASLNHPNIAQIYGIEDRALVMELVEGETLHGPLPLDQALRIAAQICDALEAAHEKGVTHRDLKPANIMITPAGVVKVLDFGLAAVASASDGAPASSGDSPTLTMRATQAGMILGTAAYMSPEQARGKPVDKRADIWAFGVVLYEMLTGKPLFHGETVSDILAGVLKELPDLERVPVEVRRLLRRCLEKDPKRRLRDIGDAMELLDVAPAQGHVGQAHGLSSVGQRWLWMVAAVFALAALALGFVHFREKAPVEQSLRYQIPAPGTAAAEFPALSPDGRNLAFVANNGGPNQVWVRAMDTLEAKALAGTDGATYPFWSPDGAYLGFFAEGKLKKIAIAGGPPQTLCDAASGRGGTWNHDGTILFSPSPTSVIFRVPAAGGTPVPVTKLRGKNLAEGNRFPAFLPDGVHFLYSATSDKPDASGVFVGLLDGAPVVRLLPDFTNALYAPPATPGGTAHIVFRREDSLMAQPFDAKGLKTTGDMFPIAEQVPISGNLGFGAFSVSENGMLAFRAGGAASNRELVWMDRAGKRLGVVGKPGALFAIAISPDEKTLAVTIGGGSQFDIWLQDLGRGVLSRFTFHPGINLSSVWSPDSSRLVFTFASTYLWDIYQKPAGGNGQEELLLHAGINGFPDDWSPDGKWIVYQETGQKTANDLWLLPLSGDRKPVPYLQTPFDELNARFSPDGRWMAYQSNESGRFQIYVQTVPPSGAKYQISSSGGAVPQWRRDGKELFYVAADQKLMAVPVKLGTTVEAGTPQPLFPVFPVGASFFSYVPMRDGQRFLVNVPAGGEAAVAPPITVVTNWQRGLAQSH